MANDKSTNLSIIMTDSNNFSVNANIEVIVQEKGNVPTLHVSDLLYGLIFEKIKAQPAVLPAGKYKIYLTASISDISENEEGMLVTDNEIQEVND